MQLTACRCGCHSHHSAYEQTGTIALLFCHQLEQSMLSAFTAPPPPGPMRAPCKQQLDLHVRPCPCTFSFPLNHRKPTSRCFDAQRWLKHEPRELSRRLQAYVAGMDFVCLFCSKPKPGSEQHMPAFWGMHAWLPARQPTCSQGCWPYPKLRLCLLLQPHSACAHPPVVFVALPPAA